MADKSLGEVEHRRVRLVDIVTDGRFNRPVSNAAVDRMVGAFDPRAFGTIVLWERDEELVLIDGQHRVEAARRFGISEKLRCIPAAVHKNLTLAEAAGLFVSLSKTKLVHSFDRYRALLIAGDSETKEITRIVQGRGLKVAGGRQDGGVSAVGSLYNLYRLGEPEGTVLEAVLRTLYQAWGPMSEAYTAALLRGVGLYFHEHRMTLPSQLAEALVRGPGAPINLVGWAKGVAGTQRMPLDRAIAEVIDRRVMRRRSRPKKKAASA